jgi:hypothetical protein
MNTQQTNDNRWARRPDKKKTAILSEVDGKVVVPSFAFAGSQMENYWDKS